MMTSKDLNAMALEFGILEREINFDSNEFSKEKRMQTLNFCIDSFVRVAKQSNPKFDVARFHDYISDVAERRRDNLGKKVAKK